MTTKVEKDIVYFKQNVIVEPLFNQWYAWPYLLSPATAAMSIANLHLKIMQSFIASPQMHISSLKNPAMLGGPFINYGVDKLNEIKALLQNTLKEQSILLELAEAIKALDKLLISEADGSSLEGLYVRVPDILKGYVELAYDLNNHPSIRFIEGLLYRSPFYKEENQSLALSLITSDDRSFAFSTPRLKEANRLYLKRPFRDKALDELFKMRFTPQPYGYIRELLEVSGQAEEVFAQMFTDKPPSSGKSYTGPGVRIRYFGHACILIESRGSSVLIDPVVAYKFEGASERFTFEDLPPTIDYVLITHNHADHCMLETLLQLRPQIKTIIVPRNNGGGLVDPSLRLALQHAGFADVIDLDELESLKIEGGEVIALPFLGEHGDLNIRSKNAYWIKLEGKSILIAADSNNLETKLYQNIYNCFGNLDILFLGMECDGAPMSWLYGSFLTTPLIRKFDQTRRLNGSDFEKGMLLVNQFQPGQVYVYAMGQEPWLTFVTSVKYTEQSRPIIESNKLVNTCTAHGIISERLYCQKQILLTE